MRTRIQHRSSNRGENRYEQALIHALSGDAAREADEAEQRELAKTHKPFGFVYFVQAVAGGPIKIGRSSQPKTRFRGLQNSSPVPLRLCRIVRVPARELGKVEREFHLRYDHLRLHGEWFHPARELVRVAQAIPTDEPMPGPELESPKLSYDGLSVLADAVQRSQTFDSKRSGTTDLDIRNASC